MLAARSAWSALLGLISLACLSPAAAGAEVDRVVIEVNLTADPGDDYVTWCPTRCRVRLTASEAQDRRIVLTNDVKSPIPQGGDVLFAADPVPGGRTATEQMLPLTLPRDGGWCYFAVAGRPKVPSTRDKDTVIEVHDRQADGALLGRQNLMVRIRKNALDLTPGERDRFLFAVAKLRSSGIYRDFHEIHKGDARSRANREAHFGPGFLVWHRAFILAFERDLQKIDASVALPYWNFYEPAQADKPRLALFSPEFMGSNVINADPFEPVEVQFSEANHLANWTTDLRPQQGGVSPQTITTLRRSARDRSHIPPVDFTFPPRDAVFTIARYTELWNTLETGAHERAHTWIGGSMGRLKTAVEDPLFFLLHCNVDRLWAHWQSRTKARFQAVVYEPSKPTVFSESAGRELDVHIGHFLLDTMWPWNGVTGDGRGGLGDRPQVAPGGLFPQVPALGPPSQPRPADLINYLGHQGPGSCLGYAYDDLFFD